MANDEPRTRIRNGNQQDATTRTRRQPWLGPGRIMAASGIGASGIISATLGGTMHGRTLLWALVLGALRHIAERSLSRWVLGLFAG